MYHDTLKLDILFFFHQLSQTYFRRYSHHQIAHYLMLEPTLLQVMQVQGLKFIEISEIQPLFEMV